MVFGKKKEEPKAQDSPPIEATAKTAAQHAQPQTDVDLHGAIDEFNAVYGGMFQPGDSSNTQNILFAIYAELRHLRIQNQQ